MQKISSYMQKNVFTSHDVQYGTNPHFIETVSRNSYFEPQIVGSRIALIKYKVLIPSKSLIMYSLLKGSSIEKCLIEDSSIKDSKIKHRSIKLCLNVILGNKTPNTLIFYKNVLSPDLRKLRTH